MTFRFLMIPMCFLLLLMAGCSDDPPVPDRDVMEEPDPVDTLPDLDPYADWMQLLFAEFPDQPITLRDVSLPRSHDAGTYFLQNCSPGANTCNTQTQDQTMKQQLEAGIRMFDIRPVLLNGVYFTQHATNCNIGCKGDRLRNMYAQLAAFLDGHRELIILQLDHYCDTGPGDAAFMEELETYLSDYVYRENGTTVLPFVQRSLREVLPEGAPTGRVLLLIDDLPDTPENRARGLFSSSYVRMSGSYANAQSYSVMYADQLDKFNSFSNGASILFELSWTLTQNTEMAVACANPFIDPVSIRDLAETANLQLAGDMENWMAEGIILPGRFPNIISADFVNTFLTDVTVRLTRYHLDHP